DGALNAEETENQKEKGGKEVDTSTEEAGIEKSETKANEPNDIVFDLPTQAIEQEVDEKSEVLVLATPELEDNEETKSKEEENDTSLENPLSFLLREDDLHKNEDDAETQMPLDYFDTDSKKKEHEEPPK